MGGTGALAVAILVATAGCGGGGGDPDAAPRSDGGTADGGPAAPAPPQIPWLLPDGGVALEVAPPELTPCPDGWRTVEERGVMTCDPYPAEGAASCPAGQAHFPGEAGCAPIGRACPAGDFAEGLADDGTVLFVLAGAMDGDGSRARPFGRVGDAIARATTGTTIALGRGTYDEVLSLRSGIVLRGACVEATVVMASAIDPRPGAINASGPDIAVQDLSVHPGDRIGIVAAGASTTLAVEGVVIEAAAEVALVADGGARLSAQGLVARGSRGGAAGNNGLGLSVRSGGAAVVRRALIERNRAIGVLVSGEGSSLDLSDAVVRDTESQRLDRAVGRGLAVQLGATAVVARALFERNRESGLFAGSGASLTVSDVVVRDTRPREIDDTLGAGIVVESGGTADVRRALVAGNHESGVFATEPGSRLAVADLVVRDTLPRMSDRTEGTGLAAAHSAEVAAIRVLVEGNRSVGVVGFDGGSLVLTDAVVRDTRSRESDLQFGRGLLLEVDATATVTRMILDGNRDTAVFAGDGCALSMTDVVVRGTEGQESDGKNGRGLAVQAGSTATVERALFEAQRDVALFVAEPGSVLEMTDVVVRDTRPRAADQLFGTGLAVQLGATVTLTRAVVERNRYQGVYVAGEGSSVELTDVTIRDMEAEEGTGEGGRGLGVQSGATASVTRAVIERCRDAGLFVAESRAMLSDVIVSGIAARLDGQSGVGVASVVAAEVSLSRFIVTGSALAGIMLAREGVADLHQGEVSRNTIGVNVQTVGFDLSRLQDRVIYRDNGRDLTADGLPVPDPGLPTEGL